MAEWFFPSWANEEMVFESFVNMTYGTEETVDYTTTCPIEENSRVCKGEEYYWNDLACACLYHNWECDADQYCDYDATTDSYSHFDPWQQCVCASEESILAGFQNMNSAVTSIE